MHYIILDTVSKTDTSEGNSKNVSSIFSTFSYFIIMPFCTLWGFVNFKGGPSFPLGLNSFFPDYTLAVFSNVL